MTQHSTAGIAFPAVNVVSPLCPHPFWTFERVAAALGTGPAMPIPLGGISTDTRSISVGDVFVALRGDRFDAHDFLSAARDAGAAALVVSDPSRASGLGLPAYVVPDTLAALGRLAAAWRMAWGKSVIAVAGSNGKTSTKELLRAALGTVFEVHATAGNLNNMVGVPLTLLSIAPHSDIAVVELGTNSPGEVALLRAIAAPDLAVLTSIGEEHLEGLGSVDGVLREECEVFRGVTVAVVPSAHPEVIPIAVSRAKTVVVAGLTDAQVMPGSWGLDAEGCPWIHIAGTHFTLPLRGAHQAANAMLALAAARACGVPLETAAGAMARVRAPSMRGDWHTFGQANVLNDAYNANPPSMRAALALLNEIGSDRQRVAFLGSMLELGAHTAGQHEAIARVALASSIDLIIGVGEFDTALRTILDGDVNTPDGRVIAAEDIESAWELVRPRLNRNAIILLKASRGMHLEHLLTPITAWADI